MLPLNCRWGWSFAGLMVVTPWMQRANGCGLSVTRLLSGNLPARLLPRSSACGSLHMCSLEMDLSTRLEGPGCRWADSWGVSLTAQRKRWVSDDRCLPQLTLEEKTELTASSNLGEVPYLGLPTSPMQASLHLVSLPADGTSPARPVLSCHHGAGMNSPAPCRVWSTGPCFTHPTARLLSLKPA